MPANRTVTYAKLDSTKTVPFITAELVGKAFVAIVHPTSGWFQREAGLIQFASAIDVSMIRVRFVGCMFCYGGTNFNTSINDDSYFVLQSGVFVIRPKSSKFCWTSQYKHVFGRLNFFVNRFFLGQTKLRPTFCEWTDVDINGNNCMLRLDMTRVFLFQP